MQHVGIILMPFWTAWSGLNKFKLFIQCSFCSRRQWTSWIPACAIKINILINKAMAPHVGLTVLKIDSARICFGFKYPGSKLGFFLKENTTPPNSNFRGLTTSFFAARELTPVILRKRSAWLLACNKSVSMGFWTSTWLFFLFWSGNSHEKRRGLLLF